MKANLIYLLPDLSSMEWLMNYNFLLMGGVLLMVLLIMLYILSFDSYYNLPELAILELGWIVWPSFVTLCLLVPSLVLLYDKESSEDSNLSLGVTGHQWYWSYDYSPMNKSFDSFLSTSSTNRLLSTDCSWSIPFSVSSSFSITSEDVIHSFSLPSMSIKGDANPGRMNELVVTPSFPGIIYGQCSEICGANHSFMPIEGEITSPALFVSWLLV